MENILHIKNIPHTMHLEKGIFCKNFVYFILNTERPRIVIE
jgi:hypothetical protein